MQQLHYWIALLALAGLAGPGDRGVPRPRPRAGAV